MSFKYSRNDLFAFILQAPQTSDGVFWVTDIIEKFSIPGNESDCGYLIDRKYFFYKHFYTMKDLHYLLAQNNDFLFIGKWLKFNEQFNLDNKDLLNKPLTALVNNLCVEDIINFYLFYNYYYLTI